MKNLLSTVVWNEYSMHCVHLAVIKNQTVSLWGNNKESGRENSPDGDAAVHGDVDGMP